MCPEYHWTTIAFNKNFGLADRQGYRSGARHRDDKDASHQVTPTLTLTLPLPLTLTLTKDASHQVAMALGDYEGGHLRVHGTHGLTDVDTCNRWARFDGRYAHEVRPYLLLLTTTYYYLLLLLTTTYYAHEVRPYLGTRYSIVYFQLVPPWDVDPTSLDEE